MPPGCPSPQCSTCRSGFLTRRNRQAPAALDETQPPCPFRLGLGGTPWNCCWSSWPWLGGSSGSSGWAARSTSFAVILTGSATTCFGWSSYTALCSLLVIPRHGHRHRRRLAPRHRRRHQAQRLHQPRCLPKLRRLFSPALPRRSCPRRFRTRSHHPLRLCRRRRLAPRHHPRRHHRQSRFDLRAAGSD